MSKDKLPLTIFGAAQRLHDAANNIRSQPSQTESVPDRNFTAQPNRVGVPQDEPVRADSPVNIEGPAPSLNKAENNVLDNNGRVAVSLTSQIKDKIPPPNEAEIDGAPQTLAANNLQNNATANRQFAPPSSAMSSGGKGAEPDPQPSESQRVDSLALKHKKERQFTPENRSNKKNQANKKTTTKIPELIQIPGWIRMGISRAEYCAKYGKTDRDCSNYDDVAGRQLFQEQMQERAMALNERKMRLDELRAEQADDAQFFQEYLAKRELAGADREDNQRKMIPYSQSKEYLNDVLQQQSARFDMEAEARQRSDIISLARAIFENSVGEDGRPSITWREAIRQASVYAGGVVRRGSL